MYTYSKTSEVRVIIFKRQLATQFSIDRFFFLRIFTSRSIPLCINTFYLVHLVASWLLRISTLETMFQVFILKRQLATPFTKESHWGADSWDFFPPSKYSGVHSVASWLLRIAELQSKLQAIILVSLLTTESSSDENKILQDLLLRSTWIQWLKGRILRFFLKCKTTMVLTFENISLVWGRWWSWAL